ncbi:MAG: peptide MFS transporter [Bacteroidia bacterium]
MSSISSSQNDFLGHPKGLFILFFTEMWERFSYYGMRAILVLFLITQATGENPGFGWTNNEALSLYGWYTMLVYFASIPGGLLADRWLGQRKTVMLGGALLCIGHLVLAFNSLATFYTGLILIILGVGGLKPNISTMVGGLYPGKDPRRDKGFMIFYIGINIGAALGMIIVAIVADQYGWHYGFGLAGIGMLLGQIVFVWGQKFLQGVGEFNKSEAGQLIDMKKPLTSVEKDRMLVLFLSFLIIIVFWGAYEQAGGLMTIYAQEKTNRFVLGWEIPGGAFQAAAAIYILIFGIPVAFLWDQWRKSGKESSSLFKMAIGVMIMGLGFLFMSAASTQYAAEGQSAIYWLLLAYLFHVIGELSASPVALSFITKLAPAKYASLMMGAYFAATGFGNKLAGEIGKLSQDAGEFAVFTGITVFCVIFGVLILALLKPLKRLTHGAEDREDELEDKIGEIGRE